MKDFDFRELLRANCLREAGAGGSNPLTPTSFSPGFSDCETVPLGSSEPERLSSIYVMHCEGWHKVGYAAHLYQRHQSFQTGCPFPIDVVFSIHVPTKFVAQLEGRMHARLSAELNSRGEWFRGSRRVVMDAVLDVLKAAGYAPAWLNQLYAGDSDE